MIPTRADIRPDSWRGTSTHHQIGKTADGDWWWFDPGEGPTVIAGVQGVNRLLGSTPVLAQLRDWGFNLLGPDSAEGLHNQGMPFLQGWNLRHAGGVMIRQDGVQLPDVFDPRWEDCAAQLINGVVPTSGLAGYVSDSVLSWGDPLEDGGPARRPSLLQVCLSLDPAYAAYHAAWEFVLAHRGGEFARLARDWKMALPNKESVRQMTREESALDSEGYRDDLGQFTQEFARRYYQGVARVLKAIDPGRLWTGAPLHRKTPRSVREIAAQNCDFVMVSEVGLGEGHGPELWVDVDGKALGLKGVPDVTPGLSEMERMMRSTREQLVAAMAGPQVVGYLWGNYGQGDMAIDGPFTSGLLDEVGRINHAHVQVLAAINRQAVMIRGAVHG